MIAKKISPHLILLVLFIACLSPFVKVAAEPSFLVSASPSLAAVTPGQSISFTITVKSQAGFEGYVTLVAEGLPVEANYSFVAGNYILRLTKEGTVNRTMVVHVNASIRPGYYLFNVSGFSENLKRSASITMLVFGEGQELFISIDTNKQRFIQGESITIFGYVANSSGNKIPDANVTLQVVDPSGTLIYKTSTLSDSHGYYKGNMTLSGNPSIGVYTIYATAKRNGYFDGRGQAFFYVTSPRPSIKILSVICTDTNGTVRSNFKVGSTVIVWMLVNNTGADLTNGLVWIEVDAPNSVPITVMFQYATLRQGETFIAGFSITLTTNMSLGQYKAIAFVSNKLISQGGRFLTTPGEATFTVTT